MISSMQSNWLNDDLRFDRFQANCQLYRLRLLVFAVYSFWFNTIENDTKYVGFVVSVCEIQLSARLITSAQSFDLIFRQLFRIFSTDRKSISFPMRVDVKVLLYAYSCVKSNTKYFINGCTYTIPYEWMSAIGIFQVSFCEFERSNQCEFLTCFAYQWAP